MSEYWRSVLEACGGSEAVAEGTPGVGAAALGRRELIQLLGASLALAGLAGCGQRPRERILPYVSTPRDLTDATLTFNPASGRTLGTASITVPSEQWTPPPPSYFAGSQKGGDFSVTINAAAGDASAIDTVSIVLKNSVGTSNSIRTSTCAK